MGSSSSSSSEKEEIKEEKITQKSVIYLIDKEEKTARIIGTDDTQNEICIPQYIEHEAERYIVTSIAKYSFKNSQTVRSIRMPSDSELTTIESFSFSDSSIESILIAPSVSELQEGWCFNTPKLKKVNVMPHNLHFICLDEKMVLEKSDQNSEEYDYLIFVNRDTKTITIPSFIKRISSYAFGDTKIESIFIPPNITTICKGAFYNCTNLKKVEFLQNSKLEVVEEDAFPEVLFNKIQFPPSFLKQFEDKSESNTEEQTENQISNFDAQAIPKKRITKMRRVDYFEGICVDSELTVFLIQGPQLSVEFEAYESDIDCVTTNVRNQILSISLNKKFNDTCNIFVTVDNLREITVKGASSVIGKTRFKVKNLKITMKENSHLDLKMIEGCINMEVSGSSEVNLIGKINDLKAKISEASNLKASSLVARKADFIMTGASSAMIIVVEKLGFDVSKSSSLKFSSNPTILRSNVDYTSSVRNSF